MGWIRVSDDFYDNDKISDVGPLGVALHFAAMGFCNRNLTDGFFKKNKARAFLDFDGIGITTVESELFAAGVDGDDAAKLVIEWMVAADLWHEQGHDCVKCHARDDGGEPTSREYLIHDYFEYQPSKAEIEAKAEANRKRVEAYREARKGGRNAVGNALRTDSVMGAVHDTPNPTPTPTVISNEITNGGGCATGVPHQRPQCRRHPHENSREACPDCQRRREWDQAAAEALAEAKRLRRKVVDDCTSCDDFGRLDDLSLCSLHEALKDPLPHQEAM